jgi:hypothetical protein
MNFIKNEHRYILREIIKNLVPRLELRCRRNNLGVFFYFCHSKKLFHK